MAWTLHTDDTFVTLEAGEHCPVLIGLSGTNGWNWASRPTELFLPRRLAVGNALCPADWRFRDADWVTDKDGDRVTLHYVSATHPITISSVWTAHRGPGPVEHEMHIHNACTQSIVVYAPESFDGELAGEGEVEVFYVCKDRLASQIISFQCDYGVYTEPLTPRYDADIWTNIDGDDTGYIPLVMLHANHEHGVYFGWEWNEGRIHVSGKQKADGLYAAITAGLHNEFCTELDAGAVFDVPAVFIGAFVGEIDDASNRLRKWLYRYMMPERNRLDENVPYVQWNAFWNTGETPGSWHCVGSKYYPMIDSIAKVGIEEVTIDVGWWQDFGDFRAHAERWPKGMLDASDYAHAHKMLFTLYFAFLEGESEDEQAITRLGPNAHPEWLSHWNVDMGVPGCLEFMKKMILGRLNEYNVDSLRYDLSPITRFKAPGNTHQGCHDAPYWAQKGFIEFCDYLIDSKPGLRIQNCNNGGALKGYAIMKRSTAVQTTDYYTALCVRRAVWDSVYSLPMMQLVTQFGDVTSAGKAGESSYRFRTYLMAAPSAHFETPDEMTPEDAAYLAKLIATYKAKVRPLVRNADVYHVLPRPDGRNWDGLELYDPKAGKGMLMIFRPENDQPEITVCLKGLEDGEYQITYDDGSLPDATYSAEELRNGLRVRLEKPLSAEWVFITRLTEEGK